MAAIDNDVGNNSVVQYHIVTIRYFQSQSNGSEDMGNIFTIGEFADVQLGYFRLFCYFCVFATVVTFQKFSPRDSLRSERRCHPDIRPLHSLQSGLLPARDPGLRFCGSQRDHQREYLHPPRRPESENSFQRDSRSGSPKPGGVRGSALSHHRSGRQHG